MTTYRAMANLDTTIPAPDKKIVATMYIGDTLQGYYDELDGVLRDDLGFMLCPVYELKNWRYLD